MTTARELITSALRILGVLETGEVADAEQAQDGLVTLNELLDSWSIQQHFITATTTTTFPVVANKGDYTIGSGGDINIPWTKEIKQAQLKVQQGDYPLDLPIRILAEQQYGAIRLKTIPSTYPLELWYHRTWPLATLYFWPVPSISNECTIWTDGIVQEFPTLDTVLNLTRGYARAIRYNLATEFAPEYGIEPSANTYRIANESQAIVQRSNYKIDLMEMDAPGGRNRYAYNWRTDGERR